jgi:signal transduction histidine kinase
VAKAKELVVSAIAQAQSQLDEALEQLERMPALDTSAVSFAAHVLNNYLTVTGGTVELILARLKDHPDAQIRTWLEGVEHATNLMSRTVSQLISSSTIPDAHLRFENVDLAILIHRTCQYYRRIADRKSIRLTDETSGEMPPVRTDRVALAAVMDNLLSNAVKFSSPGTHVRVKLRIEKDSAICDVRDEGPGLSTDDQARLFQRGATLTPRPTAGESSTGYGLAVARELIEKLGGTIWCESALGKGSCFSFRLPAGPTG